MKFQKGNKLGGRKPGSIDKRTSDQLKRVEYVLSLLDETIDADIKALKQSERARMWQDLQEYIRPKLQRSESKLSGEQTLNIVHTYDSHDQDSAPAQGAAGTTEQP